MNSNNDSETNIVESDLLQVDDSETEDSGTSDENIGAEDLLPIGSLEQADGGEISSVEDTDDSKEPENTAAENAVVDSSAVIDEEELFEEEDLTPKKESPYDRPGRWFVVHTQSGYENKVKQNLESRTAVLNLEDRILETVIPMEDVVEFRNGKKVNVSKKMFPGYLLVRCFLDDASWAAIRDTPGIVNFVGAGGKPSPLSRKEVENFLYVPDETKPDAPKKTRARLGFEINETVRVKEGPFADFSGAIVEINEDQLKVKVLVDIFGRETPVELEFSQIAQL
ncbi:MAG: transcription termination/antitermination protein NusG [Acidimicrobiales bacterium]|nr:transcription termination/antitermination protein NusG [Acidimicrobiales bacterium]